MSKTQIDTISRFQIFLLFLASASTITIIPDIFFGFSINYIGYSLLPFLLVTLIFIRLPNSNISKNGLNFILIHFSLILSSSILAVINGSKSFQSSSVFIYAFTIYTLSLFQYKPFWRYTFLKVFFTFSLIISIGVIFSFILFKFQLYDVGDWKLVSPLNEKFVLKYDKLGGAPYSFPYFLSLILTDSSKAFYGYSLADIGDFTGLSYESSLALLFSTTGILSFSQFLSVKGRIVAFLILIFHCAIGLSVTNIIGLSIVFLFVVFLKLKNNFIKAFSVLLTLIILLKLDFLNLLEGTILLAKLNSRSYEDSASMVSSLFQGGVFGDGLFTVSGFMGFIPSILVIMLYIFMLLKIIFLSRKKEVFVASALLYLFIHSLKFPNIFWQLPFSLIIITVLTKSELINKDNNLSSSF